MHGTRLGMQKKEQSGCFKTEKEKEKKIVNVASLEVKRSVNTVWKYVLQGFM